MASIPQVLIILSCIGLYFFLRRRRQKSHTTPLIGPPSKSLIFGLSKHLNSLDVDPGETIEQWAKEYGSVYKVPTVLGGAKIVVCDPRAVRDFYSKETWTYVGTPLGKRFIRRAFGRGLLWAEGESHRRQRKALTPAFSNAAIRRLTAVFYDSAYKLKSHWDAELVNHSDGLIIDVQTWMNHISIDSVGIAGFSHDFGSLDGKTSAVVTAFESLGSSKRSTIGTIKFLLSSVFPILNYIPTERSRMFTELRRSLIEIAGVLLERTRQAGVDDKSIIGLLIKAESTNGELHMSEEEVIAQMVWLQPLFDGDPLNFDLKKLLRTRLTSWIQVTRQHQVRHVIFSSTVPNRVNTVFHGPTVSLTWALIELSKQPEKQERLRKELLDVAGGTDPTWDQLTGSDYPYLDAVVHETLRLHPPLVETNRIATKDDILPLSSPLTTADGQIVTSIAISKGDNVSVPIRCINRAEAIWGPRAKEFLPERWIGFSEDENKQAGGGDDDDDVQVDWRKRNERDVKGAEGIPPTVREIQGHRHLLSFSDGPRTCLGKGFALAEFKAVLSVLIRNYSFSFDDPNTKIVMHRAVLPRPGVEGCGGAKVPMRVKRVE
uniref:Cytochrome p450 n=1 Tax=Moniliophthora roreri TaxID=221103 RepID=A0A0W0G6N4_MONRR